MQEPQPRSPWTHPTFVFAVAALARVVPFFGATEHYGDSVVRIELAQGWAAHPHLWRGFAETYQYGPLHLSLIGAALRLWPDPHLAPRALSLVFGLASVLLLYRLARRVAGETAAAVSGLGLALSPLHVQASTTGASEAVFLALFLAALDLVWSSRDSGGAARIVGAALLLGAAGLVRYDGWMYVPLFGALFLVPHSPNGVLEHPIVPGRTRLARAAAFCAVAAVPAVLWILRNWQCTGDPLRPVHHIDWDHANLARMGIAELGVLRYRLFCLGYWPASLLIILTPVLGLFAMVGATRALWRRLPGWELVAIAWLPVVYFTFRGAVLLNFRPLNRFAMVASALSLPFAWDALKLLAPAPRRIAAAACAAALVATPIALAWASWGKNGGTAEWARPISPVSTVPPGIAEAADYLRAHVRPGEAVLLDGMWAYLDIPLAFRAGLPDRQWIRAAWTNDFDARWTRLGPPAWAVLLYQGDLRKRTDAVHATEDSDRFSFRGVSFCAEARFVYATVYRRCGGDATSAR